MDPDSNTQPIHRFGVGKIFRLSKRRKLGVAIILLLLCHAVWDFSDGNNGNHTDDFQTTPPDYESLVNSFDASSSDVAKEQDSTSLVMASQTEPSTRVHSASYQRSNLPALVVPSPDESMEASHVDADPQIRLIGTIEPLE